MKVIRYSAIVIGGGHAGLEASYVLAKSNNHVGLITLDLNRIAMMPCNPTIGGPAKGIITREIDALGGLQGLLSNEAAIQIKMLNMSKGPAVRALRAQIDKIEYSKNALKLLKTFKNLILLEGNVINLIKNNDFFTITYKTKLGEILVIEAKCVLITAGTYLDSSILLGSTEKKEGPDKQKTTADLSTALKKLGVGLQRLKTGTSPRVLSSSIDFTKVEKEVLPPNNFSFSNRSEMKFKKQISCYLTYTNAETHRVIFDNIDKSPMYSRKVNGVGPRYCPSIEDKIVRFSDRPRHQIFYEPETITGEITYVNGFSTSMPEDVQEKALKTLPGMENAIITKWGYAIEYDAIFPTQLKLSLESKQIKGLFFAGQINGTSGYEEAAAQGLIAGINIVNYLDNKPPLVIARDQGYIGVLIDDLVTKGTNEPYRMLTSRAEFRLLLRNDNADERLTHLGYKENLITENEYLKVVYKYELITKEEEKLKNSYISSKGSLAKKYSVFNGPSLHNLLTRPEINIHDVSDFKYIEEVAIRARLKGYIIKQNKAARKNLRFESMEIPVETNYYEVTNLSNEAREKLNLLRPQNLGQATRISGVNLIDVQMLHYYLSRRKNAKN